MDNERLQNDFLNALRKNGARVSIFLTTGERLDGQIKSFDMYSLSLNCPEPRLIVKSAIASVQQAAKGAPRKVNRPLLTRVASAGAAATPAKTPVIQRKVRRLPLEKT